MCCGQKRDNLKTDNVARNQTLMPTRLPEPRHSVPANAPAIDGPRAIAVRYTETSRVVVAGPATGRRYEFSATHPLQMVDPRDAGAMLSTRFFAREA